MNSAGLIADLLRSVPPPQLRVGLGGTLTSPTDQAVPCESAVPLHGIVDAPAASARHESQAKAMFRLLETTSVRIGIDPSPVVQQARAWQYTHADIEEMLTWSTCTVEKHVLLLAREIAEGFPLNAPNWTT